MGYRHRREDLLDAAVEVARADGLGSLTFGRVARQVGTNDRTVVYYFPTKADLIGAVLMALGADLQALLAEAFGEQPLAPVDLGRRAWPVLSRSETQPVFALFFEILGLAAVGTPPYKDLAPTMLDQCRLARAAHGLDGPGGAARTALGTRPHRRPAARTIAGPDRAGPTVMGWSRRPSHRQLGSAVVRSEDDDHHRCTRRLPTPILTQLEEAT